MDVGGADVVIMVLVTMIVVTMLVVVVVVMIMVVVMRMLVAMIVGEERRTDEVDDESDDGNQRRISEIDVHRVQQPRGGFDGDPQSDDAEHEGRGKSGKVADLACPPGVARVCD